MEARTGRSAPGLDLSCLCSGRPPRIPGQRGQHRQAPVLPHGEGTPDMDNMVVTRREEILGQLDEANAAFSFPDLNHGYYYAIDVRLHAYGDDARWALIVETAGYNPRG